MNIQNYYVYQNDHLSLLPIPWDVFLYSYSKNRYVSIGYTFFHQTPTQTGPFPLSGDNAFCIKSYAVLPDMGGGFENDSSKKTEGLSTL